MKNSICDHIVQEQWSENDILHLKCFDVNMNLFRTSRGYKKLISSIIEHMHDVITTKFSDYSTIVGISGANVGIPLNIVGASVTKKVEDVCNSREDEIFFMINPRIVSKSKETRVVESNCGSLRLKKKVKVKRYKRIEVTYYDTEGKWRQSKFDGAFGSTIQHEIDHNLGILITNRKVE